MNWTNVKLVFVREVRDQLRDRRTLFMVAVLPLLLYPLLGVAMVQMLNTISRQEQTVVVLGAEDLPALPLIDGDEFVADYRADWNAGVALRVVTDAPGADPDLDPELKRFLESAA